MATTNCDSLNHDKVMECLTKQLSELEIFQTMYTPKELVITNSEVIDGIQSFVAKKTLPIPNHLDYTIIQSIDKLKLEISVHLPSMYPEVAPEIYVRCNQLNRHQEKSLNTELTAFLLSKHDGEVCVFTAILWLQDNAESYTNKTSAIDLGTNRKSLQKFSRYWIYSHHIYSKKKTEEITKVSRDLHLNGFCLLGKPGVICVEGNEEDCKEWWKIIKSLHWQKITLRMTESFNQFEKPRKMRFENFDILNFSTGTGHSDLGSFQKYMIRCGLVDQVNEFFRVNSS